MITARLNDITTGVCSFHGPQKGKITSSASTVIIEGEPDARVGDVVTANCGHTGTIDSNGITVIVEGASTARIGDSFSGIYSGTIDARVGTTES